MSPAQNSGKPRGKPFKKGKSGNPGGRPAGVRALLERLTGDDGEAIWAIAVKMALGKYERTVTKYSMFGEPFEATIQPTIKEQREAIQLVVEQLHGKPAQVIKGDGEDGSLTVRVLTYTGGPNA